MNTKRLVVKDTYYLGASDRKGPKFENVYPLVNGMSYNSYLISDEKTCLLDTIDRSVSEVFLKKLKAALEGRLLDYLVVHHMEPDHSYTMLEVLKEHPEATVVMNEKSYTMFKNFNDCDCPNKYILVKEGDILSLGTHTLRFVMAPMVHWPEVMMSFDENSKTMFTADAFGTFGSLGGNLFAHEVDFERYFHDEARRYYANVVGKYGNQVQTLLKKLKDLPIENIAPLHGPIWRQDIPYALDLYDKWSRYEPEVKGVLIVYGSIYGHTEEVANVLADELSLAGVKEIKIYDASKTDRSYLLGEAFKYSHLVILSSTYNMNAYTPVEDFLLSLEHHNFQNRTVALIQNGTWAPNSYNVMKEVFSKLKNIKILDETLTLNSSFHKGQEVALDSIVQKIAGDFPKERVSTNPLFNVSYGLYTLHTFDGKRQNACIINTFNQVSSSPDKVMISVSKQDYSSEILAKTKLCNVSVLTTHTPFSLIKRFGFQSGKDVDKFVDFKDYKVGDNGIGYLTRFTNSYFSLKVDQVIDLGSHLGFICTIVSKESLTKEENLTYDYYQKFIKPKPPRSEKKVVGWICKICGYIYEGEVLPPDFICPICKHGASDFERLK
jgi:flavorubredoxin/flavin reductase (DIM6/NTAB) family NADH-FMN oxidoreductase RutF/rubredoxin